LVLFVKKEQDFFLKKDAKTFALPLLRAGVPHGEMFYERDGLSGYGVSAADGISDAGGFAEEGAADPGTVGADRAVGAAARRERGAGEIHSA
jgi:hypothetical protein